MKRTFNYTDRKRIERSDVRITLREERGGFVFDASLNLSRYQFPRKAAVYVEAYRDNQWKQFDFGAIEKIIPQQKRDLTEFQSSAGLLFRVRVVMVSDRYKLIGEADRLPFVKSGSEDDKRRHIIVPESSSSLGDLLWKLEMDGEIPRLLVNSKALPTWESFATNDLFIALVYPEVLRQVLNKIVNIDEFSEDDEDGWQSDWIKFAKTFDDPGELPKANSDEMKDWIDSVIRNFAICNQIKARADNAIERDKS